MNALMYLFGNVTRLENGDYHYLRYAPWRRIKRFFFKTPPWGCYVWYSDFGYTPEDAKNRAEGRPCVFPNRLLGRTLPDS
jgi:hypothetical protein